MTPAQTKKRSRPEQRRVRERERIAELAEDTTWRAWLGS